VGKDSQSDQPLRLLPFDDHPPLGGIGVAHLDMLGYSLLEVGALAWFGEPLARPFHCFVAGLVPPVVQFETQRHASGRGTVAEDRVLAVEGRYQDGPVGIGGGDFAGGAPHGDPVFTVGGGWLGRWHRALFAGAARHDVPVAVLMRQLGRRRVGVAGGAQVIDR
jgi:hypothetical protein